MGNILHLKIFTKKNTIPDTEVQLLSRITSVFPCFSNHVKGRYDFSAKMHRYLYKIETGSLDPGCASLMLLFTQFYF